MGAQLRGVALALLTTCMIAGSAVAAFAAESSAVVPASPTTVRCTTSGHANPCWATTNTHTDLTDCPSNSPVPLFLRAGGVRCIRTSELVEISCFFQGSPSFNGDNFQDHVIEEDAGGVAFVGHIPDFFIDLNGNNPPDVNIPGC